MTQGVPDDLMWMVEALNLGQFHQFLGLEMVHAAKGEVTLRMPFRPEVLATPTYVHGGIVATLLDTAGDFAVSSVVGRTVSTIDFRVDYLKPVPAGADLFARAKAIRVGRTTAVADIDAYLADGTVAAVGRAVFNVPSPK